MQIMIICLLEQQHTYGVRRHLPQQHGKLAGEDFLTRLALKRSWLVSILNKNSEEYLIFEMR